MALAAATVMVLVGALAGPGSAFAAETPRWKLMAVPSPTNIMPNAPRDAVQELTVTATGGTFTLSKEASFEGASEPIAYNASAAEVEAALAGIRITASVAETSTGHYTITFDGSGFEYSAHAPVPDLVVDSSGLTGGTATIRTIVEGAHYPDILIKAFNVGGASTDGSTITITDELPSWLTPASARGRDMYRAGIGFNGTAGGAAAMSCEVAGQTATCTFERAIDPGDQLEMLIETESGASSGVGAVNRTEISGGGAPNTPQVVTPLAAASSRAPFGPAPGGVVAQQSSMQAGAHPNVTTSFVMATEETITPADSVKDVRFDLPPGLVGSTVGMPKCSMTRVAGALSGQPLCPTDTMVGTAVVTLGLEGEELTIVLPLWNIEPAPGEPAAFAFDAVFVPVRLDTSVLSNGNYGVRVTAPGLAQVLPIVSTTITIWGVPQEHSGPGPNEDKIELSPGVIGGPNEHQTAAPLMTNPQQCTEPLMTTMSTDSWQQPGHFISDEVSSGTLEGCVKVPFESSLSFVPDTFAAGMPAGYEFNLHVPQVNQPGTLASSAVRDVSLKMPAGVVVNPGAAQGLKVCSSLQFYGPNHPSQEPASLAECPASSKVGKIEVETPDLQQPLKGQVFLGAPECDPCTPQDAAEGKMVRLLVQLIGSGEQGIIVKMEGRGQINQSTGQITTVFQNTPQVPFSHMKFVLQGGPRAVLANPRVCGPARIEGALNPWSSQLASGEAGTVGVSTPSYEFEIKEGCFGPQFKPTMAAGMPNIQAGGSGEFTFAIGRPDQSEFLGNMSVHMPPGLLGTLTGVPLCGEAQANAGTCGAGSQIGTVEALTGPGANPFLVSGGKVYLTRGYGGSQFGLSIVVPAVAGPYTLSGSTGDGTVVVRAQIFIDPHTAQLTITSGQLPSTLDGIPLQIKAIDVRINRPGFMFNPTSCNKMAITGTVGALEGLSASLSVPFQVSNCARLGFTPKLKALTHAKHTKKAGAYLHVVLKAKKGQADIRSVRVKLPKALPSVLKTLQKACTEQQFAANPAGCPAASVVGHATVHTPVVPVPLKGPAYFVSHAGLKFPELVLLLQGYGVTIQLNGETFINGKTNVTTSTFKAVPDVPFSRFDLVLPTGANPALAGNGNFCDKNLRMPTRIVAQSGKVSEADTKVAVTGCKARIQVRKRRVRGSKATLILHVPSAGRLIANGKGISNVTKRVRKGGRIGVTVKLKRRFRGHRMKVIVHLHFKPRHGHRLNARVKVRLGHG